MSFDGSPEEMYDDPYGDVEDEPINDPDKRPYRPAGLYGWYFKVFHELYGPFPKEYIAWEKYIAIRDKVYMD